MFFDRKDRTQSNRNTSPPHPPPSRQTRVDRDRRSVAVGLRPLSPPDRVLSFLETVPGRPRDNRSRKDPWRIIFRTGPIAVQRPRRSPPISFFAKIPGHRSSTKRQRGQGLEGARLLFEESRNYFPPRGFRKLDGTERRRRRRKRRKIDGGER